MEKEMNIVSSYFFYMWNTWCEEECEKVFGVMSNHFWKKWCVLCDQGGTAWGAAEKFWAALSDTYREPLIERACELYDGHKERY